MSTCTWFDVNVVEEVVEHVVMVALRVVLRQSDILVHVVGLHILEGQLPFLAELDEFFVHTQWSTT